VLAAGTAADCSVVVVRVTCRETGGEEVIEEVTEGAGAEDVGGADGGTSAIVGRADSAERSGGSGVTGFRPCSSSFRSSKAATRLRMRAAVCFGSANLWWRCAWNSWDLSPNARFMHSRS
jgi:hypothetical protein